MVVPPDRDEIRGVAHIHGDDAPAPREEIRRGSVNRQLPDDARGAERSVEGVLAPVRASEFHAVPRRNDVGAHWRSDVHGNGGAVEPRERGGRETRGNDLRRGARRLRYHEEATQEHEEAGEARRTEGTNHLCRRYHGARNVLNTLLLLSACP